MNQKSVGIRVAPFIVGILCFLLPFIQVSCAGQKIVSITGIQLVTGTQFNPQIANKVEVIESEPLAIAAIIAFVLGAFFSLSHQRIKSILSALAAGAALLSMILLKIRLDGKMVSTHNQAISVSYDIGFWLVCLAALAGLALSFLRIKDKELNQ